METTLEHILINSYKAELISYMKSHRKNFDELIKLATSDKQRYSWRAAWLLWSCMSPNDRRIRQHIKQIIDVLPAKKDSQQRELLMVLQQMELNDKQEGYLFDICTKIWENTNKNPSLRYNAFKLMIKISKKHPGLCIETNYLADPMYIDSLSVSVRKSIYRMLGKLNQKSHQKTH